MSSIIKITPSFFRANTPLFPVYFLYLLSIITFAVFYSSLSLLLTQKFALSPTKTMGLLGVFFAFHYALGILGGKIGDRYIDFKTLFICGKIFQAASSIVLFLALENPALLFLGLSLFLVDSMVSTVSLNMFITDLFPSENTQGRLVAFLNTHIWANGGFFLGFILSGTIYHFFALENLLYFTAAFSCLTAIYSFFYIPSRKKNTSSHTSEVLKTFLLMSVITFFLMVILKNLELSRALILYIGLLFLSVFLFKACWQMTSEERAGVITFGLFMLCSIGFWSIYMLGPTFMPLFIDEQVDTVLFGLTIPPQWIQIFCPITAVMVGNMFRILLNYLKEKRNIQFSRQTFFISSLSMTALALFFIAYGLKSATAMQITFGWVILYTFMMSLGEILIVPPSKSLVGDLISPPLQGFFTGINQMSIGVAVVLSGLIAEFYLLPATQTSLTQYDTYIYVFEGLAIMSLMIGGVVYLVNVFIGRNTQLAKAE